MKESDEEGPQSGRARISKINRATASKGLRRLDAVSKIFAILSGLGMLGVTVYFASVAQDISRDNIAFLKAQRKSDIRPDLVVLNAVNFTKNWDEIVIPFKNRGKGAAKSLRVIVAISDTVQGQIHTSFETPADDPSAPAVLGNRFGMQQQAYTLQSIEGRDWISPDEVREFKIAYGVTIPAGQLPPAPNQKLTIVFSYFDIDGNEYLQIENTTPGGSSSVLMVADDSRLNDTLLKLAQSVPPHTTRFFPNTCLRTEDGSFKDISGRK